LHDFCFQREEMLHLTFRTHPAPPPRKAKRVLVVTPAFLKAEWEVQIKRFTTLSHLIVFGGRSARLKYYADSSSLVFSLVN
jgi:hypothetical protein